MFRGLLKDQYFNNKPTANACLKYKNDWLALKNKLKTSGKIKFEVEADFDVPTLLLHLS